MSGTAKDRFLGGLIAVRQPAGGFRSGLDAVMLAAAVPARSGDIVLELGSGVGVASLCLAARVKGCSVMGLEIDPDLVALANENAAANGMDERARFAAGDVLAPPRALRRSFGHVLANPPFHDPDSDPSPDAGRARAKRDSGVLARWLEIGLKRTVSNGTFTAILRADRLGDALAALPKTSMTVLPLWPKAGAAAKRVIVQVRKGGRSPMSILPGLILHLSDGGYTPEANAILRDGAALQGLR